MSELKPSHNRIQISKSVSELLLRIKAVELKAPSQDWFTWTSGIRSPIYCDNRMIISHPQVRSFISSALIERIKTEWPEVDLIVGTATAGIPHAAWVSEQMNLPMLYVRSSAKAHGKANQIEGDLTQGKYAVIVEDLISTGKSSQETYQALKDAGFKVLGVAAIFSYNLNSIIKSFADLKLDYFSLTNYDDLISLAVEQQIITADDLELLIAWRNQLGS